MKEPSPRTFRLHRYADPSGISGTGIVAWGIRFPDGIVVTRWAHSNVQTVTVWDCLEDVKIIHGHDGATVIEWDNLTCPECATVSAVAV